MYYFDLSASDDDVARTRLSRHFERVPARIIVSTFEAYRRICPSVSEAAKATHDRLEDARAM